MHRQGAGPTCWRQKNKTRLFSTSSLGRGKGSFREDPGLPFPHGKPMLPQDGPGSRPVRTASILSHCLAVNTRSRTQGRPGLAWEGKPKTMRHRAHFPAGPLPPCGEGPSWFHKSACIFSSSLIHSAVIHRAPPGLWRRLCPGSWRSGHIRLVMAWTRVPVTQAHGHATGALYNVLASPRADGLGCGLLPLEQLGTGSRHELTPALPQHRDH